MNLDRTPEEKVKTRVSTLCAINRGELARENCHICGSNESQSHHEDYGNHLDITWLCVKHHHQRHTHIRNEPIVDIGTWVRNNKHNGVKVIELDKKLMTKIYPVAVNDETHGEALEAISYMRDNHISFSAVVRDLLVQYKNNGYQFGHTCQCEKGGKK